MRGKLKVLVSAYACEPHKGSEPGVGWNWAKQIARFAEVWVMTRANNKEVIEEELKKSPVPNLHFIYYDVPKWLSFWKKRTRGLYLYYLLWQIGAYLIAKKLHKSICFDVVHHLTFGNIWLPTFMPFLRIPFIWGPVGGGEQVPKLFRKYYSLKAKIQESVRDFILATLKINPLFLFACKRSNLIIVRTDETLNRIPEKYRNETFKMIETGVSDNMLELQEIANKKNDRIRIVSVGRLIHLKGFDLAVKAFAKALMDRKDMEMLIIGDGPDRDRLKKICSDSDILDKVHFIGHLNHNQTIQYMSESTIFLFPSLKEGGAWVLFEAMMLGMPIVCLAIAGSHEIVSEECAIKVKPLTPGQTINDLAEALLKLANNPDLRRKMGEAGRKRVMEHYTWEKKGEFIKKVYEEVLGYKIIVNG